MTRFDPSHETLSLSILKDKIIVITGGSSGIGSSTISLLLRHGSKVISGDLNPPSNPQHSSSADFDFLRTDIRSYSENLALFKFAYEKYGRIDHAIANAGIIERPGCFDPAASLEDLENEPDTIVLDTNLKGTLFFAHIACTYLSQPPPSSAGTKQDKSLVLIGSVGGFKEIPGIFVSEASQHGILGLLRTLRLSSRKDFGVRVNAVCPGMTITSQVAGLEDAFRKAGAAVNTPENVAEVIVGVCAARPGTEPVWYDGPENQGVRRRENKGLIDWNIMDQGVHGRAWFVIGGEAYDIEEGLDRTDDLWLGKGVSEMVRKSQRVFMDEGGQEVVERNQ